MFIKYFILRFKIFKRTLFDELSLIGILLLFFFILLASFYAIAVVRGLEYWRYICIALFSLMAIGNCSNRQDEVFLKTQGINAVKFRMIENIAMSAIFWFFDYRLIPIFLSIAVSTPFIFKKLHVKIMGKVINSPFLKGSIEWISGFRSYVMIVFVIEIILMSLGIIYNNQIFVQALFISVSISLSFLFLNVEPYLYIRQYRSVNSLMKAKIRHIILNYAIVCSPLLILHSIFFFEKTAMLLFFSLFAILMIIGNLFLKYIYYANEYLRQLLQVGMLALFIISCVCPPFVVFLLLFVIVSYIKSVTRLKELYYDESK